MAEWMWRNRRDHLIVNSWFSWCYSAAAQASCQNIVITLRCYSYCCQFIALFCVQYLWSQCCDCMTTFLPAWSDIHQPGPFFWRLCGILLPTNTEVWPTVEQPYGNISVITYQRRKHVQSRHIACKICVSCPVDTVLLILKISVYILI